MYLVPDADAAADAANPPGKVKVYFKGAVTVTGDAAWQSYIKADLPPPKSCDECTTRYEGQYSTQVGHMPFS